MTDVSKYLVFSQTIDNKINWSDVKIVGIFLVRIINKNAMFLWIIKSLGKFHVHYN